jgi:hypothetical protein
MHGTRVAALIVMRLLPSCSFAASLVLAGCSAGTLGSPTGTGGSTGSGGTTGSGGITQTGGTTGTGGSSPGTTTLRLTLPPTQSFCDENPSCTTTQHLWILDSTGQALTLGSAGCMLQCGSCTYPPCAELPLIACPAGNFGVAVTDSDFTWDGSYVQNGSCSPNGPGAGAALTCVQGTFASPGMYIARFCATPGTLNTPDGGTQICTATGPQECVEVGFPFPATQPVVITLPTD